MLKTPAPVRSNPQNAKLHAMCRDFAKQMLWAGRKWSEEDWKRILLGGFYGQMFVPNPFGHSVVTVNKKRSSRLDEEKFAEFLGHVQAFGDENGIKWTKEKNDAPVE